MILLVAATGNKPNLSDYSLEEILKNVKFGVRNSFYKNPIFL